VQFRFYDMAKGQQNHIVDSGHRCKRTPDSKPDLAAKQLMISLNPDMAYNKIIFKVESGIKIIEMGK